MIFPTPSAQALTLPVREIAAAIETKNAALLGRLKGIGARTAQKIIATLHGKVGRFAGNMQPSVAGSDVCGPVFTEQTLDVLVGQLGYKLAEARQMILEAMQRNGSIATPEELFEEIFKKSR